MAALSESSVPGNGSEILRICGRWKSLEVMNQYVASIQVNIGNSSPLTFPRWPVVVPKTAIEDLSSIPVDSESEEWSSLASDDDLSGEF